MLKQSARSVAAGEIYNPPNESLFEAYPSQIRYDIAELVLGWSLYDSIGQSVMSVVHTGMI